MKVEGFGISVDLPDGWFGRVYTNTPMPDGARSSVLQLANVPISEGDDDPATWTQQRLGPSGVLFILLESPEKPWFSDPAHGFTDLDGSVKVRPSDLQPSWEHVIPGYTTFVRQFKRRGRYFQAWAVFGSSPAPPSAFSAANALLGRIRIEAVSV